MNFDFQEIVDQFEFEGEFSSADPYGVGHINDTFIAKFTSNGSRQQYILQRINHKVFLNPEGLMRNIEAVTSHLSQKIETRGGDPKRETLTLIPTLEGNSFLHSTEGEYWRGYLFIFN